MDPKEPCQCHLDQWFNIEGYVLGRKKIKKVVLSILLSLLDDKLEAVVRLRKNKEASNCQLYSGDLFIEVKISKDLTCG